MQQFDILTRDLNVFDTHFLQASAGTGKTFSIEHFFVRLLIEKNKALLIDQILVVTFTRAATRELKNRIRRNLTKTLEALKSQQSEIDYLKAIIEEGEESVSLAITRIEEALICFDQAQIFTVHGFCHRMLSDYGFQAGLTLDSSDPEDLGHMPLIALSIKDFFRIGLIPSHYSTSQIARVLSKFRKDFGSLSRQMSALVAQERDVETFPPFHAHYAAWEQVFKTGLLIQKEKWLADFALLSPCYKQMGNADFILQVNLLASLLEKRSCTEEEFEWFLSQKELFLEKMETDNLKVRAKFPPQEKLYYPQSIEHFQKTLLPIFEAATDPSRIFLRMVGDCKLLYTQALEKTDQFSPDGLLSKMQKSLDFSPFLNSVRAKYRAAIIDEFQDTDVVQWDIFQTLFLNHVESICLVGDPKQSIYAFRNADIYTYLAAAKAMGEKSLKYLDTNFRSTPSLVSALNRLFEKKGWMRLPALNTGLEVPPVKFKGLLPDKQKSPLHFFIATESSTARTKRWPSESMENQFFAAIAEEMIRLTLDWDRFTVLVKDRYQAERLSVFLKQYQIPSVLRRAGALNETIAFDALIELLQAVCNPSDLSAVKQFLSGPFIQCSADEIQGDFQEERLQQAKAQLLGLQQTLSKGFGPFFQEFLKSVNEDLLSRSEISLYTHLRQLAEILIEEEVTSHISNEGFLSFLKEMKDVSVEEESRFKIRPQEERGSVLIMTIHMSKGLEFDVVFAYGLIARQLPFQELLIKREGKDLIGTLNWQDPDCVRALEELDAEKMRQLYVALTRAKTAVYIPVAIDEGKKALKMGQTSPVELFLARSLYPDLGEKELYEKIPTIQKEELISFLEENGFTYSLVASQAPSFAPVETPEVVLNAPPSCTIPYRELSLFSFTSLATKKTDERQIIVPIENTLPLGVETGLIFHKIIEKVFDASFHFPIQKEKIAHVVLENNPLEEWHEVLTQLVVDILGLPILDFALKDIHPNKLQQEMEFVYPVERGLMKGFADLFFEHGGKYYLLDWKTNYLTNYSQESLTQAMEKNDYFLQASLYAEALRRYVKLFDMRPFEECFGGAIYLFVRGKAVLHFECK